jgi:hypothetical protein
MADGGAQMTSRPLWRKEAAYFLTLRGLPICAQTLARLYSEGRGPACMHVGRRAAYREIDLLEYLQAQVTAPRRSPREPKQPAELVDLSKREIDTDG